MATVLSAAIFALGAVLSTHPNATTVIAQEAPPCPIRVTNVSQDGLKFRIQASNSADYPVDHVVLYVTFNDYLQHTYERRYPLRGIVQPNQSVNVETPYISRVVVNFSTGAASFTCRQLTD